VYSVHDEPHGDVKAKATATAANSSNTKNIIINAIAFRACVKMAIRKACWGKCAWENAKIL